MPTYPLARLDFSGKIGGMFLRTKKRIKDGKEHRYWSIVENHRTGDGKVCQRQVLYLGEINDSQHAGWCRAIEVLDGHQNRQMALFSDDREAPELACETVQLRLSDLSLHRPRQWGACWLACQLWDLLRLDQFWSAAFALERNANLWFAALKTLVIYRLLAPGSEWRLHREWFRTSALGDLLESTDSLAQKDRLYRCLDKLVAHKKDFFAFLTRRWQSLFAIRFDVLLYDLTSTYFECNPPGEGKRQFGYSRDKRSDCVQVVIALIVTPDGFPLAYEVMPGNTADKSTLLCFLEAIEEQYGKADRTWVMDRGIPTEEVLELMRSRTISYLVGTPRGRLTKLSQAFLDRPWEQARQEVRVKLLEEEGELYILARSDGRVSKERAMRTKRLKRLWRQLKDLQKRAPSRDTLLLNLGAAKKEAGRAWGLVKINLPKANQEVSPETFTFQLDKKKLRQTRRQEGCYLLRSNLTTTDPAHLWDQYIRLTEIEQAFKELKGDLSIRPIYHQTDARIEAHIFVAFMAYCLQVTLKRQARHLASGLTPRAILDKFATMQMVDVYMPTIDGRHLVLPRYTQPDRDLQLLLTQLKLTLPKQPPPRLSLAATSEDRAV